MDNDKLAALAKRVGELEGEQITTFSSKCDWCGAPSVRVNLDGDDLCQMCANKWVRAEGMPKGTDA